MGEADSVNGGTGPTLIRRAVNVSRALDAAQRAALLQRDALLIRGPQLSRMLGPGSAE